VRRAALAGIVVPALLVVLPLYAYLLGTPVAIAHAMLGLAGAALLLEILLLSYEKVPFTCAYVPSDNLKAFGIPYTVAFLIGGAVFAVMERAALQSPVAWLRLVALVTVMIAALRLASRRRSAGPPVDFNEAPVTTQRLGLHT
jgi:hypothetical protein